MAAVLEARPACGASNPVAAAVWRACIEELEAPKPGNVSFTSAGHGMTADDFVASARCTADVLGAPGLSLGERGAAQHRIHTRGDRLQYQPRYRTAVRSARAGGARRGSGPSASSQARPHPRGGEYRGYGTGVRGDSPGRAGGAGRERASRRPKPGRGALAGGDCERPRTAIGWRASTPVASRTSSTSGSQCLRGAGRGGRPRGRWWRSTSRSWRGLRTPI